jgi:hypothetical protein
MNLKFVVATDAKKSPVVLFCGNGFAHKTIADAKREMENPDFAEECANFQTGSIPVYCRECVGVLMRMFKVFECDILIDTLVEFFRAGFKAGREVGGIDDLEDIGWEMYSACTSGHLLSVETRDDEAEKDFLKKMKVLKKMTGRYAKKSLSMKKLHETVTNYLIVNLNR